MNLIEYKKRKNIQEYVKKIKIYFNRENRLSFPIIFFAENILPAYFNNYSFEIVDYEVLGNKHAETYPDINLIQIRSDIYDRASKGYGRDRMTIAHEVGHLILHRGFFQNCSCTFSTNNIEWEANVFAGELLASSYLIKNMTVDEVAKKCLISKEAATIQLKYSL